MKGPRRDLYEVFEGSMTRYHNGGLEPTTGSMIVRSAVETSRGTTRRKPSGWLDPTPYTFSREIIVRGHGTHTTYATSPSYIYYPETVVGYQDIAYGWSNFWNSLPYPIFDDRALRDRALTKARLKMKDMTVNYGVALAEARRSQRLVTDTALALTRSMRELRRGHFKKAARQLGWNNPPKSRGRTIPQKWLELQYGWKPLLSDVFDSAEALSRLRRQDWRVSARATERVDLSASKDWTGIERRGRADRKGWKGCHVRIDAVPSNGFFKSSAATGITNPLTIAWELVPFSFVVDWFLPVGNYLDSLDAMLGYTDATATISTFMKFDDVFQLQSGTYRGANRDLRTMVADCSPSTRSVVKLERRVTRGVPLPSRPRFRDPRSLSRFANAMSLLALAFAGRKRR